MKTFLFLMTLLSFSFVIKAETQKPSCPYPYTVFQPYQPAVTQPLAATSEPIYVVSPAVFSGYVYGPGYRMPACPPILRPYRLIIKIKL
jgi:hypothetical protein